MDSTTVEYTVDLFSSLANATRLRIVELLTEGELTVNEVAHELGISQPNASQHLAILQRNAVVKVTPRGTQRCYSMRGPRIARILILVDEFRNAIICADGASPATSGAASLAATPLSAFSHRDGHDHDGRDGAGPGSDGTRATAA